MHVIFLVTCLLSLSHISPPSSLPPFLLRERQEPSMLERVNTERVEGCGGMDELGVDVGVGGLEVPDTELYISEPLHRRPPT
jgi:hypothetical protein